MVNEGYSLSDIAAATGRENNNDGFGGNGAWWLIVLFLFMFNRGWGNGFGGNGGAMDGYVLTSDFANIERKIDGVNSGICQNGYTNLEQFANTNMGVANGFSRLDTSLCQLGNNIAQQTNAIQSQIASCCCETQREVERGFADTNYNLATQICGLQNTLCGNTRDIIENQNANYRAIHDELVANKIEAKNERIAELSSQVSSLQLKASQEAQNNYLVGQMERLNPNRCPEPAYIVPNPNCCYQYNVNGVGYNSGCGCM